MFISLLWHLDIDECDPRDPRDQHNCGINTHCIDGEPGFNCACNDGYEGDPQDGCTSEYICDLGMSFILYSITRRILITTYYVICNSINECLTKNRISAK